MKKFLPLFTAASLFASGAMATIHTITTGDFAFVPSSIPNAHVGDTVMWVWNNGSHTTTSVTVPTGATMWDTPLNSTNTTFSYILTTVGSYTYHCTPHAPNMAGSITVSAATGIERVNTASVFSLYPNPADNSLHIELKDGQKAEISIIDALGRKVSEGSYDGKNIEISTAAMAAGMYLVKAKVNGEVSVKALEVRH